jgi:UDP-N-acetyl-D-glucosamine dehydrogenase
MRGKKALKDFTEKVDSRRARVAVIGMGYVGLPLAVEFAQAGFKVTGVDVDAKKVKSVNQGTSYIPDVQSRDLRPLVRQKMLRTTADFRTLQSADAISICVPTPLRKTGDPDISFIVEAVRNVRRHLHPGVLVVLESTTYPGTTTEVLLPKLESSGMKAGRDFFLAFSPERVDPGRGDYTTGNTPKVFGGYTRQCGEAAKRLYGAVVENVVQVSSPQAAEMVKLLENTFRSVNIGLVNEIALICNRLGLDVWEIIDAAATKPFGFMPFYPGPGLGGHCIPVDPHYLSWKLKALNFNARFIELAGEINCRMPQVVVERVASALNERKKPLKGAKVHVLGVAYKKDVSDTRESPALDVMALLEQAGTVISYSDPFVPKISLDSKTLRSQKPTPSLLKKADAVVIVTDHTDFDYKAIVKASRLLIDTRNAVANAGIRPLKKVVKL